MIEELSAAIEALPLIDHHVHGLLRADLDRPAFEASITESFEPAAAGTSWFDSPARLRGPRALRAGARPGSRTPRPTPTWPAARELGAGEVNRRMLAAVGGRHAADRHRLPGRGDHRPDEHGGDRRSGRRGGGAAGGGRRGAGRRTVRTPPGSPPRSPSRLAARGRGRGRPEDVVAYRLGLDFDPARPSAAEVAAAAGRWLAPGAGRAARPIRCCCAPASGPGWTSACRCSSTSATATPTSTCTAATRC